MLARLALPPEETWAALQAHARDRGLVFLSSPFDEASADLLEQLGVPAFKVGSGELTNTGFIAHLARKGRPLLVSTGMATMVEVADALETIGGAGGPPTALFHCVSAYPARPEDANLRAIGTLRAAFGVPAGWSDHTPGTELPIAAAALGADLIEKHLTLDRTLPGPDHAASLEPGEMADDDRGDPGRRERPRQRGEGPCGRGAGGGCRCPAQPPLGSGPRARRGRELQQTWWRSGRARGSRPASSPP